MRTTRTLFALVIAAGSLLSLGFAAHAQGRCAVRDVAAVVVGDTVRLQVTSQVGDFTGARFTVARANSTTTTTQCQTFEDCTGPGDCECQAGMCTCVTLPTSTSTTTTSTSTTLPPAGVCGDPVDPPGIVVEGRDALINASDALAVLTTAVNIRTCPLCVCDVNDSGSVTATDALIVVRFAVGQGVSLTCPGC